MDFNSLSSLVGERRLSLWERIYRKINPTPLRNQIVDTLIKLNVQKVRLAHDRAKLEAMAKDTYNETIKAKANGDEDRAKIYANEYVEIRKMCKLILKTELVLEAASLRLETVRSFGDIVATVIPLQTAVNTLRSELIESMPQLSVGLSGVFESLKSIMVEIGEASMKLYKETIVDEAGKILEEASVAADQKIKEKLPEIPIQDLILEKNKS